MIQLGFEFMLQLVCTSLALMHNIHATVRTLRRNIDPKEIAALTCLFCAITLTWAGRAYSVASGTELMF